MKLNKVIGQRRQRVSQPNLARHARKCTICHHKDRPVIDFDYLNWRSIQQIVKEYALTHRVALYRHAAATGLTALRKSTLHSSIPSSSKPKPSRSPAPPSFAPCAPIPA